MTNSFVGHYLPVCACAAAMLAAGALGTARHPASPPAALDARAPVAGTSGPALDARLSEWFARPRFGPLRWGLYRDIWGRQHFGPSLDSAAERLGARPQFFLFFRDLARPYPAWACQEVADRGAIPVISLELVRWRSPGGSQLEAIVRGEYDDTFVEYARTARASGTLSLLRFGFEMNGDWFPWGCQPELFIRAWRHVHDIFTREDCRNVRWVWAPNAISGPNEPENGIEKYWPGDAYVDVIGLDGYNFGDHHGRWHRWTSCEAVFRPALDKICESGVPHPVLITEFACAAEGPPERRADWIRAAYRFFEERGEVIGAIWFDYDKSREGEPDWRIDADERSLGAWRETFGRPG